MCYAGDGEVVLEGGRRVLMQDLRIGDRVQVAAADGSLTFDDIYFFGHRARGALGSFTRLMLSSRQILYLFGYP